MSNRCAVGKYGLPEGRKTSNLEGYAILYVIFIESIRIQFFAYLLSGFILIFKIDLYGNLPEIQIDFD